MKNNTSTTLPGIDTAATRWVRATSTIDKGAFGRYNAVAYALGKADGASAKVTLSALSAAIETMTDAEGRIIHGTGHGLANLERIAAIYRHVTRMTDADTLTMDDYRVIYAAQNISLRRKAGAVFAGIKDDATITTVSALVVRCAAIVDELTAPSDPAPTASAPTVDPVTASAPDDSHDYVNVVTAPQSVAAWLQSVEDYVRSLTGEDRERALAGLETVVTELSPVDA